jgi:hypothetical protein
MYRYSNMQHKAKGYQPITGFMLNSHLSMNHAMGRQLFDTRWDSSQSLEQRPLKGR